MRVRGKKMSYLRGHLGDISSTHGVSNQFLFWSYRLLLLGHETNSRSNLQTSSLKDRWISFHEGSRPSSSMRWDGNREDLREDIVHSEPAWRRWKEKGPVMIIAVLFDRRARGSQPHTS